MSRIKSEISKLYKEPGEQHFLRSSKIRDYTLADVAEIDEDQAFEFFVRKRWGSDGVIQCPICDTWDNHYVVKGQKRWRCKVASCGKFFSVLYGTIFQDRKISYKKLLMLLVAFVCFSNGVSFTTLSLLFSIQVKTAEVFVGKIREVLIRTRDKEKLKGLIHIDGGHFGGRPRHGRVRRVTEGIVEHVHAMLTKKSKQPFQTAKANAIRRKKKRRVVIVLRQLSGIKGVGALKTLVFSTDGENEETAMSLAQRYIEPGSLIMSDENAAYNQFTKYFNHEAVEHAKEFARLDGVNNNQAESYFSRLRRHVLGVSHRIEPKYMEDIAVEMAWREDVRRMTISQRLDNLLEKIFLVNRSCYWTGYWQKCNRPGELIWNPAKRETKIRPLD